MSESTGFGLGEAKLRREQVVHVELLAGPTGPLHVEPQGEGDADDEAGRGDAAHQALARRLDGEEVEVDRRRPRSRTPR